MAQAYSLFHKSLDSNGFIVFFSPFFFFFILSHFCSVNLFVTDSVRNSCDAMKMPSLSMLFQSTEWKFFCFCVRWFVYFRLTSATLSAFTRQRESVSLSLPLRFTVAVISFVSLLTFTYDLLETNRGCVNEYHFIACIYTKDINYGTHTRTLHLRVHFETFSCFPRRIWVRFESNSMNDFYCQQLNSQHQLSESQQRHLFWYICLKVITMPQQA